MFAAEKGHLDVVKFLVEHGANIFEKDKDNKDASDMPWITAMKR